MKNVRFATLFITLGTLLLGLSFSSTASDDFSLSHDFNVKQPIPRNPVPKDPTRPRAPSLYIIYFTYISDPGVCVFDFPQNEEGLFFKMEHTENHMTVEGSVSYDDPVWNQFLPSGEYEIQCESFMGNTYTGVISID